jgi:2-iminobutanoate/2-iminopropanoate deaminase
MPASSNTAVNSNTRLDMKTIDTGLPPLPVPMQWAVVSDGGVLYTSQVPIRADGQLELGDARAQTELMMRNLDKTLRAAGTDLSRLLQVQLYMTDPADAAVVNQVYAEHIKLPYPNRASFFVSALAVPGLRVEIVATAQI